MDETIMDPVDTGQPEEAVVDEVGVVETPDVDVDVNTIQEDPVAEEGVYEIGGERITLEEYQQMKQGYLRQSDYTKKTQEIARMREENETAIELFSYLQSNPHLIDTLRQAEIDPNIAQRATSMDPAMQRVAELEEMMYSQRLDAEITNLKSKYPDFNEVEVLTKAQELNTMDLEFVYKGIRNVDEKSLIDKAKKELMAEINENKNKTKTVVSNNSNPVDVTTTELTQRQLDVATKMGIDPEDYAKFALKR